VFAYQNCDFSGFFTARRSPRKEIVMNLLSITVALILTCLGSSPYGGRVLNSAISWGANSTTWQAQQEKVEASAYVNPQIQGLSSANPRERAEAACALGKSRSAAAIPALIKLLGDDTQIDQPICNERGNWGDEDKLNKTSPGEMAAVALSQIGSESVEPLINVLKVGTSPARENAAFALGLIKDYRSVEPLIAATTDSEWQVRAKASWSLGLVGDSRAVEPLTRALKDVDWHVRSQAAWALGLKGDHRAVEPLVAALSDMDSHVQSQAAWALGLKGDQRAVEPLTVALRAQGEHVRSQAAWAMGLKGDERSVEPLIAALRDTNRHVRSQAAWALGLKGDERSVEPLKAVLNDADEHVRKQAAWALQMNGMRGGRRVRAGLSDSDDPNPNPNPHVVVEPKVVFKYKP
jgi:HEAT repeat protein